MFHSRHRQRGQSAWSSLFTIMMVLFLAITVMKLWGAYYNDYSIGKVVTAMGSDASLVGKSPKEITELLLRRLDVNTGGLEALRGLRHLPSGGAAPHRVVVEHRHELSRAALSGSLPALAPCFGGGLLLISGYGNI